jgi:streptogrisin C
MRSPTRSALGIAALGLAFTSIMTAPASAQTLGPDDGAGQVDPGLLSAMAEELGTDTAGALDVLAFQDTANATTAAVADETGAAYAGSWLDESTRTVYTAVTTTDARQAAESAGAVPVEVAYSIDDLEAISARLAEIDTDADVTSWWIDVTTNQVVVEALGDTAASEVAAQIGAPADAVRVETTAEAPETFATIQGGIAYTINGTSRCSVGFAVEGGFVTAGHCGRTGASTNYGTFRGSSFPGDDYAWVATPSHTPVGTVSDYAGGSVAVSGSTPAAVGATVCRSGSTTGWHCGQVQAYNSSVRYSEGTVSGLIRTSVCAERGDSGGSLLAGNQAQGVTSGGSGNCSTGGTTYFQPVNEILQAYGLRLLTR